MKSICIVTTKQPGTNPRMRKNADALAKAGFDVTVLYSFTAEWADDADEFYFKQNLWKHQRIGGHPQHRRFEYNRTRIFRKWGELTSNFRLSLCPTESRFLVTLDKLAPDLVLGHNLGSLPILTTWAKRTGKPVIFDAEDYHRCEPHWTTARQGAMVQAFEDTCMPRMTAVTTASPQITQKYQQHYPDQSIHTINNAFSQSVLSKFPSHLKGPLKVIWFSQVVGMNRGLQEFLTGLALTPQTPVELSILGISNAEIRQSLSALINSDNHCISFHEARPEHQLTDFIAQHEIGLCLEKTSPENNNVCRANKLYTYPLAGCFMFVSKTQGQIHFLEEWPVTGRLVDIESPNTIAEAITWAYHNRDELTKLRETVWELAKSKLNWEVESTKIIDLVQEILEE